MNEKDNIEMYDEIERDLQDKLMNMDPGDPNRKPIMDELQKVSSIRIAYQEAEQNRINSNFKNDNDDERLAIEKERLNADKKRNAWSIVTSVASPFIAGGIGYWINYKSYRMDEKEYAYKGMKDFGKRVSEFFTLKR